MAARQPSSQTARPAATLSPTTTATSVPVRRSGLASASLSPAVTRSRDSDSDAAALVDVTASGKEAEGADVGGTLVGGGVALAGAETGSGRAGGASAIIVPPRGSSPVAGRDAAGLTPGGGVKGGAAGERMGAGAPNTVQPRVSDDSPVGPGPGPAFGVETSG